MQFSGNTILVTGGGTGIGRGLAEAFHQAGSTVIIAGRRESVLKETVDANPGMHSVQLDTGDPESIRSVVPTLLERFPTLNAVLHSAGIMKAERFKSGEIPMDVVNQTIGINLTGVIGLTAALLPHLLQQPSATIFTVTSGLASVPLALNPTYCATKAAIHSWTQSLRYQLQHSNIEVLEIVPPYTQTELTGAHQKVDPVAMPLDEYLRETIALLQAGNLPAGEVLVKRVHPQRHAERENRYDEFYKHRNDTFIAARGGL